MDCFCLLLFLIDYTIFIISIKSLVFRICSLYNLKCWMTYQKKNIYIYQIEYQCYITQLHTHTKHIYTYLQISVFEISCSNQLWGNAAVKDTMRIESQTTIVTRWWGSLVHIQSKDLAGQYIFSRKQKNSFPKIINWK